MPTILTDNSTNIRVSTDGWTLRVYASRSFHDKDNNLVWEGAPGSADAYINEPFASSNPDLPEIVLPSTTASIDDPNVTYSLAGVYDTKNKLRFTILENFRVIDTVIDLTWSDLKLNKNGLQRPPLATYIDYETTILLILRLIAEADIAGRTVENVQDIAGAMVTDSAYISASYNDATGMLVLGLIVEAVQDMIAEMFPQANYNDASGLLTIPSGLGGVSLIDGYMIEDYGAVGDGVTDDTEAFKDAIDAMMLTGKPCYLGAMTYLVNGAFDVATNAVIPYPQAGINDPPIVIKFIGSAVARTSEDAHATKATVIKRTLNNGSGVYASVFSGRTYASTVGGLGSFNKISMEFENIMFAFPNNPTFTFINAHNVIQCQIKNCQSLPENAYQSILEATHSDTHFCIFPGVNNNTQILMESCVIAGWYNGIRYSEHLVIAGNTGIGRCVNGMVGEQGFHLNKGKILLDRCYRGLKVEGQQTVHFDFNIEQNNFTTWDGTLKPGSAHVYDPSDLLHGKIDYKLTDANVGDTVLPISRYGATDVYFTNLFKPHVATQPVDYLDYLILDGFDAATLGLTINGREPTPVSNGNLWSIGTGSAVISSAGLLTLSGATANIVTVNAGATNAALSATRVSGAAMGFVGRYVDVSNYLLIFCDGATAKLYAVVAGVSTELGSAAYIPAGDDLLAATFNGTTVTFSVNGVLKWTVGGVTDHAAATKFGLRSFNTAIWYYFAVQSV
jgi:hypothetical protein